MKTIFTIALAFFALTCLLMHPSVSIAQDAPAPIELLNESVPPVAEPETIAPDRSRVEDLSPRERPSPYENYSDIPKEALDDMEDFNNFCTSQTFLSRHYDCQCWSMRYLDERIIAGPNASRSQLILNISGECINIPGAAAYAHDKCEGTGRFTYDGSLDPAEYCDCIGNNYAILLQTMGERQLTKSASNTMMTSAILRCKAPPTPSDRKIFRRLDK